MPSRGGQLRNWNWSPGKWPVTTGYQSKLTKDRWKDFVEDQGDRGRD